MEVELYLYKLMFRPLSLQQVPQLENVLFWWKIPYFRQVNSHVDL